MKELIQSEPVLTQAVIQAGLGLLMSFQLHLTAGQMTSILTFTGALLALWARAKVTAHPNNAALNPPKT